MLVGGVVEVEVAIVIVVVDGVVLCGGVVASGEDWVG